MSDAMMPRPWDYREAWPHALGAHMKQTQEVLDHIESLKDEVGQTASRVAEVERLSRESVGAAAEYIRISQSNATDAIAGAIETIQTEVKSASRDLTQAQRECTDDVINGINRLMQMHEKVVEERKAADGDFAVLAKAQIALADREEKLLKAEKLNDARYQSRCEAFDNRGWVARLLKLRAKSDASVQTAT